MQYRAQMAESEDNKPVTMESCLEQETGNLKACLKSYYLSSRFTDMTIVTSEKEFKIADKYDVPDLKKYANSQFECLIKIGWVMDDFPLAIAQAYAATPTSHRGLRDAIVRTTSLHFSELLEKGSFVKVLENTPGFSADMAKHIFRDRRVNNHASGALPSSLHVSTYRDLYNATPTPQPGPRSSVTSDLSGLVIQSNETARGQGREEDNESVNSFIDDDHLEGDDDTPTYNIREEALPRAPIYDVGLQNALREVRTHLTDLKSSMARFHLVHDESTRVHELYKQIESMSRFEYPETRIVGFIGDSGVGKSSLINSLLDCDGLARTSASGVACTSVVTEFRHIDETHRNPFTVEADFMNMTEMNDLLEELLRAYRMHHTIHEVSDREDPGERDRIRSLSARSWETLKSLFPDEADMTEQFLSSEAPGAQERILGRLKEWALAGLDHRPGGPNALNLTLTADTIHDCKGNLDVLTVTPRRDGGTPAIWPFVKLIRVYLDSPILRTGLVVADLPGLRDLNYARERATTEYLRCTCEEIFVVSEISRCTSDPSIRDTKDKLVRRQHLRIVCTKSESEVNVEEFTRDPDMPREAKAKARELRDRIKSTKASIDRLSSRRRSSGRQGRHIAIREVEMGDELYRLEFELEQHLIEARNTSVTTALLDQYQQDVKVYCVSSKLYSDHRRDSREQTHKYIQLSGIPGLRQYCQSVPAEAQLRATSGFLTNRVPGLLLSLSQWVLAGANPLTVERAATLRRVLDEAQRTLQARLASRNSCVQDLERSLNRQFTNLIIRGIRTSQERWITGAIRAGQDWATLYHSTYFAFCRKYGTHQPKDQVLRYWNEEILQDANDDLVASWSALKTSLYEQHNAAETLVVGLFAQVCETLEDHVHLAPEQLANLLESMEAQKGIVLDAVQRAFDDLLLHTERITQDVLDGRNSTSYIREIMRPAYNACQADSGTGSDARRKRIMDHHIRTSQIFVQFANNIKAAYLDIMGTVFSDLRQRLREEVQNIAQNLGAAITDEDEIPETEQAPELATRVRAGLSGLEVRLNEAQSILQGLQNGGES
ncbi:hypothetical protein BJX68DRAFT_261492 [Aspergillus pseudodeflectus]|uniref:G domain-containing protein n=1 Tax=Aspergillus pseudodeflectus TaxID=176178 RepID=A0ABR4L7Q0_9EURO